MLKTRKHDSRNPWQKDKRIRTSYILGWNQLGLLLGLVDIGSMRAIFS